MNINEASIIILSVVVGFLLRGDYRRISEKVSKNLKKIKRPKKVKMEFMEPRNPEDKVKEEAKKLEDAIIKKMNE